MVDGLVPLDVARELYADEVGKKDVRARGDCGCPSPDVLACRCDPEGRIVVDDVEFEKFRRVLPGRSLPSGYVREKDAVSSAKCITCYHIDSQTGLNLFVKTIKAHGLVTEAKA
jgi:hypothetical protein